MCRGPRHKHGCRYGRLRSRSHGGVAESARGRRGARSVGIIIAFLVSVLAPVASAQQAESPEPLTGDPAIDT